MHVPRADRANERFALANAQREHDQDVAPLVRDPDCFEPFFDTRMRGIRNDCDRLSERCLDRIDRDSVLLAFVSIGAIPIKSRDQHIRILFKDMHPFVNTIG